MAFASTTYTSARPPTAIPLSRSESRIEVLRAAGRLAKGFSGLRSRTPSRSISEYNARWQTQFDAAPWSRAASVDEAVKLSSYGDANLCALVDFSAYRIPARDFFLWRSDKLASIFRSAYPTQTPLLEIGCGAGKNLAVLSRAGYSQLRGFDPTPSAVECVRSLASTLDLPVEVSLGDVLNDDLRRYGAEDAVVFTNHVLEQLPGRVDAAIARILAARPREVLHIEPLWEAFAAGRPFSRLSRLHVVVHHYQRELLSELERREQRGELFIREVTPLGFSPKLVNWPTLIRWVPS